MSGVLLVLSLYLPWIVFLGVVAQAAMPARNQVVSKPLSWFKVKGNPRKRFDESDLRALGKDLRVRQLQPLVCLADGTIVCGERRYRAAVLEGLAELMVMIITDPLTEAEHNRLQLVENLQRIDLNNAEKCIGCVKYAQTNPSITSKQIAADLGVDPSMVTRWMSWERAIDSLRAALEANQITLQTFYSIAQLSEDLQEAALKNHLNPQKPERMPKIKIPLANDVATGLVVVTGKDIDLDDTETLLKEALKAVRAAKDKKLDCKTAQSVWRDMANAG